jgi:hypothetical protein
VVFPAFAAAGWQFEKPISASSRTEENRRKILRTARRRSKRLADSTPRKSEPLGRISVNRSPAEATTERRCAFRAARFDERAGACYDLIVE